MQAVVTNFQEEVSQARTFLVVLLLSELPDLPRYGEEALSTLLAHYGVEKPAKTMLGEPTIGEAIITMITYSTWNKSVLYIDKTYT